MISAKQMKKYEKEIAQNVFTNIINKLFEEGVILESDFLDKKKIDDKVGDYIVKNHGRFDFELTVDHRETLIETANREYLNGSIELAIGLYATFVEHTLNKIIFMRCKSKKLDLKTSTEIIKSINISGKCTWLLKLLGLPNLNINYLKIIYKIAEERNSYFHYKWKPEIDCKEDVDKVKHREQKLNEIKRLLRYLKNYESKIEFKGKKQVIKKITQITANS
jgi:hypothetical protein